MTALCLPYSTSYLSKVCVCVTQSLLIPNLIAPRYCIVIWRAILIWHSVSMATLAGPSIYSLVGPRSVSHVVTFSILQSSFVVEIDIFFELSYSLTTP